MTDQTTKIPFTQTAYQQLQADFDKLTQERVEVMARLKTAREMGDLSENGAYIYAKMELGRVNREMRRIQHLLDSGHVVHKSSDNTVVQFGCTVTLQAGKMQIQYTVVSMHESDLAAHKLSIESPLGQAIIGRKVGDKVTIHAPAGEVSYSILKIE
jgi:transcription elongation factor GreA